MAKLGSNRNTRLDNTPRRGRRTVTKRLVRARKARLHTLLAKVGYRG